jgi:hypothetical protein
MTDFFVGREHCEARSSGLVLVRSAEGPERNRAATELSEPALELGLGSVVRKTAHVQNLAPFTQERTHVSTSIHRTRQDIGMLRCRLRLVDQAGEHTFQGDGFVHCSSRRCWSECLKVKRQIVLDGSGCLDGLHLESGADVAQRARSVRESLRVCRLPPLVFGAEVEASRMLQVWRQNDRLVPSFTWKLNAKVPRVQCHESCLDIIRDVVLVKGRESIDGVPEATGIADVFPCQRSQAGCFVFSILSQSSSYRVY